MTDKNNKPNEAEDEKTESIGIPSVAARKRNTSKIGTFSALLLILVLLIIIGFGFYQKNKSGSKQDEKPQVERSFSSKALTLLPLSEIQLCNPVIAVPKLFCLLVSKAFDIRF